MLELMMHSISTPGSFSPPVGENKLTAVNAATGDKLGYYVDVSGDGTTIAISAPLKNSGAGYIYVYSVQSGVWTRQGDLRIDTSLPIGMAATNIYLGLTIRLSYTGDRLVAGAYGYNSSAGCAVLFSRNGGTWSYHTTLVGADTLAGDMFGFSCDISGDGKTIVVGSRKGVYGSQSGAVYVFKESSNVWTQSARLTQSPANASEMFGYSVAISSDGHTIASGAIGWSTSRGAVFVFTAHPNSGLWSQLQRVTSSDGLANEWFGHSVSLSTDGKILATGAHLKALQAGAAYVFQRTTGAFSQDAKLVAFDTLDNSHFGYSLMMSGDGTSLTVGAPRAWVEGYRKGAAYKFVKSAGVWSQQSKFTPADVVTGDNFAYNVAISEDAVVNVFGTPVKNSNRGAVYVVV